MPLSTKLIAWLTLSVQLFLGCYGWGPCLGAGSCHARGGEEVVVVSCCGAPAETPRSVPGCCGGLPGEERECSCCTRIPDDPANPGRMDPRPEPGDEVRQIVLECAVPAPLIAPLDLSAAAPRAMHGGQPPPRLAVKTVRLLI